MDKDWRENKGPGAISAGSEVRKAGGGCAGKVEGEVVLERGEAGHLRLRCHRPL